MMKIRLNLLPVALVMGILAASIGCKNDDDEELPPPPPPPVNSLVIAFDVMVSPAGLQQNEVEIRYSLIDADSNIASVLVEYSTNGGATFLVNTPTEFTGVGSSGTFPLATSPFPGVSHKFVWDTWADLGAASGTQYVVRITPSDTELGVDGQTQLFSIDNSIKAPPVAVINSSSPPPPPAILAGDVRVDYQLFDNLSWPATVIVEISTNGGASYQTASEATGTVSQGLFNLTTSPTGAPHVFVWDSVQDVVGF
ncbi:MAG: hypothetical protein O6952_02660, partial [Planctomycetota bacterium]|nr:hypothetical protein [Planctomycetota bacterium]